MWKELYRKANDEISLNNELLNTLLESAEKKRDQSKHYIFRVGTVAAAAVIGLGIFSYSYLQHESDLSSNPIAEVSETKSKVIQQTEQPKISEAEQQRNESVLQHSVMVVEPQKPIIYPEADTEIAEIPEEKNEDLANLPAMASNVMPRALPLDEQSEEIPIPEFSENDEPIPEEPSESDIDEEDDAVTENTEDSELSDDEKREETVHESQTPAPTPEAGLTEIEKIE